MKKEHFGQYLVDYVRKTYGKTVETIGCTDAEIETLMEAQGVSILPKVLHEYLEIMGKKGISHPVYGRAWSYESLLRRKQGFKAEYADCKHTMPDDSFIIYQAVGVVYHYFRASEGELDYPVYVWQEEDNSDGTIGVIKKTYKTLQEYFMSQFRPLLPSIDKDK